MEEKKRNENRHRWRILAIITVLLILVVAAVGITYAAYKKEIIGYLKMPKAGILRAEMSLTPDEKMALEWDNDGEDKSPSGYEIAWVDTIEGNDPYHNNQNWLADLGPGEKALTYANYAISLATATDDSLSEEELAELTEEQRKTAEAEAATKAAEKEAQTERVNNRRMILSVESNVTKDGVDTVSDTGIVYNLRIYTTGMLPLDFVLKDNNAGNNTYPLYYSKCTAVDDDDLKKNGWYYLYKFYAVTDPGTDDEEAKFEQLLEWLDTEDYTGAKEKDQEKKYEFFVGWDDTMENAQDGMLRKETERLKVVVHLMNDPNEEHGNPEKPIDIYGNPRS